jgi:hypothetical protein
VTAGTVTQVTFGSGGSTGVTIPEGGDVYSNPVTPVGFSLTPGSTIAVSVSLTNGIHIGVMHVDCSSCRLYRDTASDTQTANTDGSGFVNYGTLSTMVAGVDVQTHGIPTVVVLGDNLIDPDNASQVADGEFTHVSVGLAAAEIAAASGGEPAFSVVSAGDDANDVQTDYLDNPSAVTRLGSDVLAVPNVGTVVIDEGLQDLIDAQYGLSGLGVDAAYDDLRDYAYPELASQLNEWGISTIWATLTPCYGMAGGDCTAGSAGTVDADRQALNGFLVGNYNNTSGTCPTISAGIPCQYMADFDTAVATDVADGSVTVEQLIAADAESDDVNLTQAGYTALTPAIPLDELTANTLPDP